SPATISSGAIEAPYGVRLRSAIVDVVSCSVAPSLRRKPAFAVERPQVAVPKLRVFGLPRKATTTASPELATRLSVSTAARGRNPRRHRVGGLRAQNPRRPAQARAAKNRPRPRRAGRRDEEADDAFAEHRTDACDHRPHVAAAVTAHVDDPAGEVRGVALTNLILDAVREPAIGAGNGAAARTDADVPDVGRERRHADRRRRAPRRPRSAAAAADGLLA